MTATPADYGYFFYMQGRGAPCKCVGDSMKRINAYNFYSLAIALHPLTEISQKSVNSVSDVCFKFINARFELQAFLAGSFGIQAGVCRRQIEQLINNMSGVLPNTGYPEFTKKIDFYKDNIHSVVDGATALETILKAELDDADTYFVSTKRIYKTDKLIAHADEVLRESIRSEMPSQAIEDFRQAGRCIAFECHTAAASHILRSLEAVLRKYIQVVTGQLPKKKLRNWGPISSH